MFKRDMRSVIAVIIFLFSITQSPWAIENAQPFDTKNFIGERINLPIQYSKKLHSVRFSVHLPENYRMLYDAKPYIRIFTKDGAFDSNNLITSEDMNIGLNHVFKEEDELFILAAFYYCRDGKEGLCLIKNLLYNATFDNYSKEMDVFLDYTIANEY